MDKSQGIHTLEIGTRSQDDEDAPPVHQGSHSCTKGLAWHVLSVLTDKTVCPSLFSSTQRIDFYVLLDHVHITKAILPKRVHHSLIWNI